MLRRRNLIATILLAGFATACGSSSQLLEESLDYGTGVTLTRSTAPIVLYHDNSGHAAYARDYVYLGPIEVNRMGSYSYYLWLGIWSTLDDASRWTQRDGFESIVLYADGEPLQLEIAGWSAETIGASRPVFVKPVTSAADAYYAVTVDQIRMIAEARDLVLQTVSPSTVQYHRWRDGDAGAVAMRQFVTHARP
jgi:hypothetical protein